jgi:hypothetical protein
MGYICGNLTSLSAMVIREGKTPGDDGDTPTRAIPLGDNISFKDGLLISASLRLQKEL